MNAVRSCCVSEAHSVNREKECLWNVKSYSHADAKLLSKVILILIPYNCFIVYVRRVWWETLTHVLSAHVRAYPSGVQQRKQDLIVFELCGSTHGHHVQTSLRRWMTKVKGLIKSSERVNEATRNSFHPWCVSCHLLYWHGKQLKTCGGMTVWFHVLNPVLTRCRRQLLFWWTSLEYYSSLQRHEGEAKTPDYGHRHKKEETEKLKSLQMTQPNFLLMTFAYFRLL